MAMAAIDFQLLANAGFPPATFKPGEVIFAEGDKGDKMYVIRSGEVEIERDGKVVEKLSHGGIFGEMALIDVAAGRHGAGRDALRGCPHHREELPLPGA
jgi:CRP/FNR family cyclic AMP-dependent transcriptional regulator